MNVNRQSDALPAAVPNVIYQKLSDGAVLFLAVEEVYFGLNEVGALVWSMLPPANTSFTILCDGLVSRFPDVPRATLERDVSDLLDALVAERLVSYDALPRSGADESVAGRS
jgi:hypothetical protein